MKTPAVFAAVAALALAATSVGFSAQAQDGAQISPAPAVAAAAPAADVAKPAADVKLTEEETAHAEDVIKTKCTVCHGTETIVAQHLARAEWGQVLENMGPSAELTKPETALVLRYLAENLGPENKS